MDALPGLKNQPLVIAFSGGGDSLALLALACEYAPSQQIVALIVDHGLRKESAQEARQAAQTACELGAQTQILHWQNPRPGQMNARQARYSLLAKACRGVGAQTLFLAHTKDDQEETFAIRLSRGSTVRGLASMSATAPFPLWPEGRNLLLARPLLGVTRQELRHWLQTKKYNWIEDPSNYDKRYARVRARLGLTLLQQNGLAAGRIARSVRLLGELENTRRQQAEALLTSAVKWHRAGFAVLRHELLTMAEPIIAQATIATILAAIAGNGGRPLAGNTARRVITRMNEKKAAAFCMAGCRLEHIGADMLISRDPGAVLGRAPDRKSLSMPVHENQIVLFDNRFEVIAPKGGWIEALGQRSKQLPKRQRDALYTLPAATRPMVPVFCDETSALSSPVLGGSGELKFLGKEITARLLAPFSHITE